MGAQVMAEPDRDALDRLLEAPILKRGDRATGLADGMMVVLAARHDGLVARGAVSGVYPLDQSQVTQKIERAVDAGNPDTIATAT